MYVPPAFAETRTEVLHDAIRAFGLATLVTQTEDGLIATHLPLMIDPTRGAYGTLIGHLARPNPQARGAIGDALVIWRGPDAYITPSYYPTKKETGKVVPTWNYAAVHAYGSIRFVDDKAGLLDIVTSLTDFHEAARAERGAAAWAVSDAPADFVDGMLRGIVGIEIEITRLEGKWKMSQNRPEADRLGVVSGLNADGHADVAAVVGAPVSRS